MENDPDWAAAGTARTRSRVTTQRAGLISLAPEGHRQDVPLFRTVQLEGAAGLLPPPRERRPAGPHPPPPPVAPGGRVTPRGPHEGGHEGGAPREPRGPSPPPSPRPLHERRTKNM